MEYVLVSKETLALLSANLENKYVQAVQVLDMLKETAPTVSADSLTDEQREQLRRSEEAAKGWF